MAERVEFQRELDMLHRDLTRMGAIIEKSMEDMIEALITHDPVLAREIIDRDDEINEMELKIEKQCILLIARQQPIASDLRDITGVLKIITDLERIGDHCADISEYTIQLANESYVRDLFRIPEMVDKVKRMVQDAIQSSVKKDIALARDVCKRDDEVDQYFYLIIDELVETMKEKPDKIKQCKDFIFIVKYLERMGDHATNIAEWVIYAVTGKHDAKL